MSSQPDTPTWSEEELSKFAAERGSGIPEGMEVWTEDELQKLTRKRQGGLDIPEWKEDESMKGCVKCGYSLRPGWSRCPVCETPVGTKPELESIEKTKEEVSEVPKEELIEESKGVDTEELKEELIEESKGVDTEEPKEEPLEEVKEEKEEEY